MGLRSLEIDIVSSCCEPHGDRIRTAGNGQYIGERLVCQDAASCFQNPRGFSKIEPRENSLQTSGMRQYSQRFISNFCGLYCTFYTSLHLPSLGYVDNSKIQFSSKES